MRGTFDSSFFGLSDCKSTMEVDLQRLVDQMQERSCDYDAGRAGTAWVDVDEMTCEEFYEGEANEVMAEIWGECATPPGYYTTYTVYEYAF
jgi:hypothetical protein